MISIIDCRRAAAFLLLAILSCLAVWSRPVYGAEPGVLLSCGMNQYGSLGDGTRTDRYMLGPVSGLEGVTQMATGGSFSLAVKSDGTVWAWGRNSDGQLGNGSSNATIAQTTPVQVSSLTGVTAVGAGMDSGIALMGNGTVWTWGWNGYGQVGDGTTSSRSTPIQVSGLTGVIAISAGRGHLVALKSNGTVWAWGQNNFGQVGDGGTTNQSTPMQVSGLSGITSIAAGMYHNLALKSDGTIWAWGWNEYGQLGDGTTTNRSTPVQMVGLNGVTALAAGFGHSLALTRDGSGNTAVWGWGGNYIGQLGDGTTVTSSAPVQAIGLDAVAAIASGGTHSVALRQDGTVLTWGDNYYGQRGDPSTRNGLVPMPVAGVTAALAIAAGVNNTLVTVAANNDGLVARDDNAACRRDSGAITIDVLGNDYNVQGAALAVTSVTSAGHGSVISTGGALSYTPQPGYTGSDTFTYRVSDAHGNSAMSSVTVWIVRQGTLLAWGRNNDGQLGDGTTIERTMAVPVNGIISVIAVTGGYSHSMALRSDGTVWTWGNNTNGQLGSNSSVSSTIPLQVSGLNGIIAVAAGANHSLALKNDGTVWAWGNNNRGQLGDGSTSTRRAPIQVIGLSGVTAIAGGGFHSVAIKSDGTVWAWGLNDSGQLGDGTLVNRSTPVQVSGLSTVTAVSLGSYHSLALRSDGTLWAWGWNASGQIGDGTTISRITPVQVSGLTGVTAIATGQAGSSLALRSDGTVWAWGNNSNYQLGNGVDYGHRVPERVTGLTGVGAIAAGAAHGLAFKSPSSVWGWGNNANGYIGDSTIAQRPWAVRVLGLNDIAVIAAGTMHSFARVGTATPPTARDETYTLTANTGATTLNVLANDSSNLSDPLSIISVTQAANGSVSLNGDGSGLTYTPATNYVGTDSFTYTISNGEGVATATAMVTVVSPINISGRVTLSDGTGLANVNVSLTPAPGGVTNPVVTDGAGNYRFIGVPVGNYVITPTITGYSFNPASRSVSSAGTDMAGQNFIAAPWVSVSGIIKDGAGIAVSGVSVALSGGPTTATTTTNSAGYYTFSDVPSGSYEVAPTLTGYTFSPPSRTVQVTDSEVTEQNFICIPAPTVTGFTPALGAVGAAVTITGTNFTGATTVKFNTTSATFTVDSATQIVATVPAGATTGKISVTTPGGTGSSTASFSVDTAPTSVTITTPVDGSLVSSLPVISGGAIDNVGGSGINRVSVTLLRPRGGGSYEYWNSATGLWQGTPVSRNATLSAPNALSTNWNLNSGLPAGATLSSGPYFLTALAYDNAGLSTSIGPKRFTVDSTAPTGVTITSPVEGSMVSSLSLVKGSAVDNVGGSGINRVSVTLLRPRSGGGYEYWNSAASSWQGTVVSRNATLSAPNALSTNWVINSGLPAGANLASGPYFLTALAYDNAGLSTSSGTKRFTVDSTAPTSVAITTPTDSSVVSSLSLIKGSAIDNVGGSGINRVSVTLLRPKSGGGYDYWNSVTGLWQSTVISRDATLSAPNALSTIWSLNSGLPAGASLPPGTYFMTAYAYDNVGKSAFSGTKRLTVPVPTYSISGRVVTSAGVGIANVSVKRSGSTVVVLTNATGYYTFTNVPAGSYVITPSLAVRTFTPVSRTVSLTTANATNVNFIGEG